MKEQHFMQLIWEESLDELKMFTHFYFINLTGLTHVQCSFDQSILKVCMFVHYAREEPCMVQVFADDISFALAFRIWLARVGSWKCFNPTIF